MKQLVLLFLLFTTAAPAFCQIDTLHKKFYTIIFDEGQKVPLYTFYILTKAHVAQEEKAVKKKLVKRTTFHADKSVPASRQANNKVYTTNNTDSNASSGKKYERGHLAPDADFKFSQQAEKEAMLYTNCAPQVSDFNENLWGNLEDHIRKDICKKSGDVKIYTGCIYGPEKLNGIPIPSFYWKVIFFDSTKEEYLGENKEPVSNDPASMKVQDDKIEELTGLSFSKN